MAMIVHASGDLLLKLGALPIPLDENGKVKPKPTKGNALLLQCGVTQAFLYWDILDGAEQSA